MSLIRRLWNVLRNPAGYVGRDLEGNTYFETKSYNDPSRMKRTVQYQDPDDMWKYIGNGKRLPVQWSAWLTHTRRHPPTLQELEADLNRRRRVLSNALVIEARDNAEAEEMKRIREHGTHTAIEDAVKTRTERTRLETGPIGEPGASKSTLETQEIPLQSASKVLPPKFLTSRRSKSSKMFAASPPPLDSDSPVDTGPESQAQAGSEGRDEASPRTQHPSPWKTSLTDTESWSPKTRKRGY